MQTPNLIYDTNTLIAVVPNLKTAQSWLLDNFFTNVQEATSEAISIDIDIGKRRMSPFVSPMSEGKLVEQRRFSTNSFKPAYIKDKRAPDLRKPVRRAIGERIGGAMTPMERQEANLEFELTDQLDMLTRRQEWMASQVLQTGSVTVAGDGFATALIDFGRDSSLTIAYSGASTWGNAANFDPEGRDPLPKRHIELWQNQMLKKSGAVGTDIIFTTTPWEYFTNGKGIYGAINFPKLADNGNNINPGAQIQRGAVFKGTWGNYRLWLYNDWYVDTNDVEQQMIPDGTVIMTGPQLLGVRGYGIVMDPRFNYEGMPFAPKTWYVEDPGQQLIMLQSAPLIIPSRPNASLAATVCSGLTS